MLDIAMCLNKNCPLRMKCYRFTAVITPGRQLFMDFKPVNSKCDGFWDNTGRRSRFDKKEQNNDTKNI